MYRLARIVPGFKSSPIQPAYIAYRQLATTAHHGPRPSISHRASKVSFKDVSKEVTLAGWLTTRRQANSNIYFFELRDASGTIPLVLNLEKVLKATDLVSIPLESVVQVSGIVQSKRTKTGSEAVEVNVHSALVLNPAQPTLPFYPNARELVREDLRARYRYLDLRREQLAQNIKKRSKVTKLIRDHLHELEFTEVETPILLQSSPEGAREYLVPTRLPSTTSTASSSEPQFYALQQSPQQPKQLLISSGLTDKYFQVARCFRDESGRKDRQAEFTQVDIELGFVSGAPPVEVNNQEMRSTWRIGGGEVRDLVEGLIKRIWKEIEGVELPGWFQVMPYDVAMDVYGSDKPDTRFKMYTLPISYYPALSDADIDKLLTNQDRDTVEFMITSKAEAKILDMSKLQEELEEVEKIQITAKNKSTWPSESTLLSPLQLNPEASRQGGVQEGEIVWLAKRRKQPDAGWTKLGKLRVKLRDQLVEQGALVLPTEPHFLWITEFPLFTKSDDDKEFLSKGRYASSHHPFTAPMYEDLEALREGKIEGVRGQHYDLVLNGMEVGGGSVRVHDAELQEFIFKDVLKLEEDEVARFAHLLQALKFGAPPHGGIALGLDRLVAILCGTSSIKDVIAFPKTSNGIDPVFKSPSSGPDEATLALYGLKNTAPAEEKCPSSNSNTPAV